MKKTLSLMLALAMLVCVVGCAQTAGQEPTAAEAEMDFTIPELELSVPAPMQYPDYTVGENPTIQEMRETAARAMEDYLRLQWTPSKYMCYYKIGAAAHKQFNYVPGYVFTGLPYTNAGTALVAWFEYYDPATGVLNYPGDGQELNRELGAACSRTVYQAWLTVCNSMTGNHNVVSSTKANGFIPIGPYTYNDLLTDFSNYFTTKIVEDNGEQIMCQSYAVLQQGDGLVSVPNISGTHVMMCDGDPVVVYNDDGTINPDKSYVPVQDQRAGSGNHYYDEMYGDLLTYRSGRYYAELSFKALLSEGYLPYSNAEFLGLDPYEIPEVTFSEANCTSIDQLLKGKLEGNYPLSVVKVVVEDAEGNQTVLAREIQTIQYKFNMLDLGGDLSSEAAQKIISESAGQTVKLLAVIPNGQVFTLAEFVL